MFRLIPAAVFDGPPCTLLGSIGCFSGGLRGTFLVLGGSGGALCWFLWVPVVPSGLRHVAPGPVAGLAGSWGLPVGPGLVVFCGLHGLDSVYCVLSHRN